MNIHAAEQAEIGKKIEKLFRSYGFLNTVNSIKLIEPDKKVKSIIYMLFDNNDHGIMHTQGWKSEVGTISLQLIYRPSSSIYICDFTYTPSESLQELYEYQIQHGLIHTYESSEYEDIHHILSYFLHELISP